MPMHTGNRLPSLKAEQAHLKTKAATDGAFG
jgi:hypothetical protein